MKDDRKRRDGRIAQGLPAEGAGGDPTHFTHLVNALNTAQQKTAAAQVEKSATQRDRLLADTALYGLASLMGARQLHLGQRRRASFHGGVADAVSIIAAGEAAHRQDDAEASDFSAK